VPDAQYIPPSHMLDEALEREAELGIDKIVLVQPSVYGNDNSCLIEGLRRLGPYNARGVVAFDPSTVDPMTLRKWHELGVRGVRVNFQSVGKKINERELEVLLRQYADLIRPLDWVLQLYISLSSMAMLERILPPLRIKACLDHFGSPSLPDLYTNEQGYARFLADISSLARLIECSRTYVKISAYYRLCKDVSQLEPIARILFGVANGEKVVFGTDWPHTRFAGLNIEPFIQVVLDWCNADEELINRVFRDNAATLWDAQKSRDLTSLM
jgi:predicted TIM-barrel fold metal-dependent hydrolase